MIDTLMVIWNRGNSGRSILVSLAVFLICISTSLLLISLGEPLFSQLKPEPHSSHKSIVSTAKSTPTPQSAGTQPAIDNQVTINAPTATATASLCYTPAAGRTPSLQRNSTTYRGGGKHDKPQPTPTRPRPIPTPTPRVTPTSTPTPRVTPTMIPIPMPTATLTPIPTPTSTPTPRVTPTSTPTPRVTPTVAPTPVATLGATPTATLPASPGTIRSFSRLGGGNPVPSSTTSPEQDGNTWNTDCLHAGYSLDGNANSLIMAAVERNLWLILAGSALGTLLFYPVAFLLARRRIR